MPSDSPGKICSRCGKDCTNKPRAKDADGNYVCADCVAKAKAVPKPPSPHGNTPPKPPPVVASSSRDAGDQNILGKLIDQSVEEHRHGCPNCHAPMKASQILCIKCGFNKERGKQVQTVVKKAAEEKGVDMPSRYAKSRRMGKFMAAGGAAIGIIALLSILALGGLFAMAATSDDPTWTTVYLGVQGIYGLITGIIILVCMFMDEVWKGLVGLLCGFYMLYWVFVESDSKFLQLLFSVSVAATIAGYFLIGKMTNL